jgi:hypothetical protein
MGSHGIDEKLLVQYLLGRLSEEKQAQVEDRAFADSEYRSALEAAEADLIDTYVRGELAEAERRAFEAQFLNSPERRSKVEFARALAIVAVDKPARVHAGSELPRAHQSLIDLIVGWRPTLRFAMAMAALIFIAGLFWTMQRGIPPSRSAALEARHSGPERKDEGLAVDGPGSRDETAGAGAQEATRQSRPPVVASLVLFAGLSRAESTKERLVLGPLVERARIEIQLEARDDYPQFRVELRTQSGNEILTRENLRGRRSGAGSVLSFDLPANALSTGQYELAVQGVPAGAPVEDVTYLYFTVEKSAPAH